MKGDPVSSTDNVVRYVSGSRILGDTVLAQAFEDSAISVNWLECRDGNKDQQLDRVRRLSRLKRRQSGRFAELNVGTVRSLASGVDVVEEPLEASAEGPAAPCHAEIVGVPEDEVQRKLVFELLLTTSSLCTPPWPVLTHVPLDGCDSDRTGPRGHGDRTGRSVGRSVNVTTEAFARAKIDGLLKDAGWDVTDAGRRPDAPCAGGLAADRREQVVQTLPRRI